MRDVSSCIEVQSFGRHRCWVFTAVVILVAGAAVIWYWCAFPKTAEQLVEEGQVALDDGAFLQSVNCAERAVAMSPQWESAWKLLAEAASRNGQVDRALEGLEELARLSPSAAGPLGFRLGSFWLNRNEVRPAIRALHHAEKSSADALPALRLERLIAAVTGHTRETVRCIIELLKRGEYVKGDLIVVTSRAQVINDPEWSAAALKADPKNKSPSLLRALYEIHRNHIDDAENLLLEITSANPEDEEARGALAELYAQYKPEKFLRWHSQVPPNAADDARLWSARGKWLAIAGDTESAIRCLHEALWREPEQLSTTVVIGEQLKLLGESEIGHQFAERSRRLQRIIELNVHMNTPREPDVILPMIEELEATGRLWEAWGWCNVADRSNFQNRDAISRWKRQIEPRLSLHLPRTEPGCLPGNDYSWDRFPLPDWSRIETSYGTLPKHSAESQSRIRFDDVAAQAGITFRFVNSYAPGRGRKIHESLGAGVGVLDFDQDGWPDLYFPQGNTNPLDDSNGPSDCLYRNLRGERFEIVSNEAGIDERSYSHGVAVGDYDSDGFPDIYVANFGRNRLFRNCGDGTFSDATHEAGLTQTAWTVSCAIADLTGDGLPELFDVNYVQGENLLTALCLDENRRPSVCRPTAFQPATDTVAINIGDGMFQEQQAEAGLELPLGIGLGLVIADFNGDRRPDIFVANDMTPNYLLINQQIDSNSPLKFVEEGFLRNVALSGDGLAKAGMGVACADINRDHTPDLFVTNFARESNTLYLSHSSGFYRDATQATGLREPSFDSLGFGTQFLDADRDGWFDLVIVNGHIDVYPDQPYQMKSQFFRGTPEGRFTELMSRDAGELFDELRLGRGLALLDFNRDGWMDFVATDLEGSVLLAVNRTESGDSSLRMKLIGTQSNRDAVGATVEVLVATDDRRTRQVTAGDGYESSNERIVEIGVGKIERVNSVKILWPSGAISQFDDVACDSDWLAIEGAVNLIRGNKD